MAQQSLLSAAVGAPLSSPCRPTRCSRGARGGLIPLASCAGAPCRLPGLGSGEGSESVRGIRSLASVRPVVPTHHHQGPTSWEEVHEEEDHRSSQVALLALVPIGLMSLKWAVSTGPVALAIPLVLLAFPIAGSGLRQLLAEGVSMAVRCSTWMQSHQPPRQQALASDHNHHSPHNGNGNGNSAAMRRSPGAPALAQPAYGWSSSAVASAASMPASHLAHPNALPAAAMQHHATAAGMAPVPASGPSSMPARHAPVQPQQQQPVGAWADVTLAMPHASRVVVPATGASWPHCSPQQQQQQHYAGAGIPLPAASAMASVSSAAIPSNHPQHQMPHVAGLAAPSRQQPMPPVGDHHHRNGHHVPHAAPSHHAATALPAQHAAPRPQSPATAGAAGVTQPVMAAPAHAPPTARPLNLPPPSTLQQLADVQQCEDIDWEVDARKQQQHRHAGCPGAGAPAMAAGGVVAASERAGSPASVGALHHHHMHGHGGHSHAAVHRHPPHGPAASPRGGQQWP